MPSPESLIASSLLSPETITQLVQQSTIIYTSHTDVQKDHRKWRKDRKLQSRNPIGTGITLEAPFEIPLKKHPSTHMLSSGFRQPLPLIGRAADQNKGSFVGYLTLGECLRVHNRGMADMWIANIVEAEGKSSGQRVVVRIAQQSSLDFPQQYLDRNVDLSQVKIVPAINLVAGEFFIYERLQHLQGWILPYSFGLHKIKMSNDEDAYVFITEYIEGRNLRTWKAENAHASEPAPAPALTDYFEKGIAMIPLFMNSLAVLHADGQGIVCMGLYGSPEHVILTEDSESGITGVVFVDLQASVTPEEVPGDTTMARLMEFETLNLLAHVVECCPTHKPMFIKWMQAENFVVPQDLL